MWIEGDIIVEIEESVVSEVDKEWEIIQFVDIE